jgi:hypothetical protein
MRKDQFINKYRNLKDLYHLGTDKFFSRGGVLPISDAVCGLREVDINIDETVVDDIVNSLVNKLGWESAR